MALAVYRPRNPHTSPLFRLLESLYDTVRGVWEDRFEPRYGFWRGRWDAIVARYLDCGDWNSGFARVRCGECAEEFYFFRQRELLGDMSRLACETIRELMAAAADDKTLSPGMVTFIQTFGE